MSDDVKPKSRWQKVEAKMLSLDPLPATMLALPLGSPEDEEEESPPVSRPEWLCCIASSTPDVSLCGRSTYHVWVFTGMEHARASIYKGTRLVPCEDCLNALP